MNSLKKHSVTIAFAIISLLSVFTAANVKWGDDRWHGIIRHDANGYYAYLPAVFIYQDLNFNFYDTQLQDYRKNYPDIIYEYRESIGEKYTNKYYAGTALAEMPFFLTAHVLSSPMGFQSDGYSKIYYVFISLAAIFYAVLGLWFLKKILDLMGLKNSIVLWSLMALYFGTHLFYYTLFEPGMSHVYSFAFISMFIYYGKKYFIIPDAKKLIILSLLLGIISLIRPLNIILILLIPFLSSSKAQLISGIKFVFSKSLINIAATILPFLLIVSLQLIIYKIQTGHFIVYSYTEEGFNFLDPHFIDILFSYKKGLFLYTPLCFLALIGFYQMSKNKFETRSLIIFLIILTYLLSSWWSWWYGGSFSSRVYVDYLSLFGILLALSFQFFSNKKLFKYYFLLVLFLVLFNQKQTYLYRIAHIHWVDMNKERYWQSTYHPFQLWFQRALGKPVEE